MRGCALGLVLWSAATIAAADTIRVASYNASLTRSGPGLLLRDITKGEDPQIEAAIGVLLEVRPDILLLNEFDYDGGGAALAAFQQALRAAGHALPHSFAAPVNTGIPSGLDLDGDGTTTDPQDAFGFGRFPGQYGMAVLSRFPIPADQSYTFRLMRWADLPGALLPTDNDGAPFPSAEAHAEMRLSSKSHWDVAIDTPLGPLRLLASHPTPPVFDGPEDFNGRRNHDEIRFWVDYLDGADITDDTGTERHLPEAPFIVAGDLNADPIDGDGRHAGISALLNHPRLQDPLPKSAGAVEAATDQGGANIRHQGDHALDTADWNDGNGPGNLRVDYVLPSRALTIIDAGVFWPARSAASHDLVGHGAPVSSDHRLVWVDIQMPPATAD